MVNVKIDYRNLSQKLEEHLRKEGYGVKIQLKEGKEGSLILRCIYKKSSYSTAISYEATDASIQRIIPAGEDSLIFFGNFSIKIDRIIRELDKLKEPHGI